ncbi:MAG: thermosome subunit beta [Candidatus Bathyarchaeia archaeon]
MSQSAAPAGSVPVIVLKEGTGRTRGGEARRNNIMAGKIVAEALKSTLGPKGMDKMLVTSLGDTKITSDGATVLKEIDVQHPAAKMLVEAAKAQDAEVGDGTTTVAVLIGELLKKAEELLDEKIHATIITAGYRKAALAAVEILKNISQPIDLNDRETIRNVVSTTIKGTVRPAGQRFAETAMDAVMAVKEERGGKYTVDKDRIQTIKKTGASAGETSLVKGVIVDKEVAHPSMPKRVENARIAVLKCPLEVEKPEMTAEVRIRDPAKMKAFLDEEVNILREKVETITAAKANVAFTQKAIDDMARHFLSRAGILVVKNVKESDIEKLERATGAKAVTDLESLKQKDLGSAELVEERKLADDKLVFVEGCKEPRSVAILIRGGLEKVVDEAEIAMNDAISVVADVVKENRIVAGGGAVEMEIVRRLKEAAVKLEGREQLAFNAFVDALEAVPRCLIENAGLDPVDKLVELRVAHSKPKGTWMGINQYSTKVEDMMSLGVIEPMVVKQSAIRAATEAAALILRVDDVITGGKAPAPAPTPGGMPPGGMPPGY